MNTQDQIDNTRENLDLIFTKAVLEYIAPILITRGFAYVETKPYAVRFKSADVTIDIFHNRLSYEIEIAFMRNIAPEQRYVLNNMMDLVLDPDRKQEVFFQASTPERVIECIKAIAELLEKFGHGILAGDPATYNRIDEIAQHRSAALTKQRIQKPIREAAENAWQSHDYVKVRNLYESMEADLMPLERKRLEYAKNH